VCYILLVLPSVPPANAGRAANEAHPAEPMKGSFKDHDVFARLACWSLKRYRLETWLATTADLRDVNAFTNIPYLLLAEYETSYQVYCLLLEQSSNGKTRVAALFLKVMSSYDHFKTPIRTGDPMSTGYRIGRPLGNRDTTRLQCKKLRHCTS
jgi:hypothetical protein